MKKGFVTALVCSLGVLGVIGGAAVVGRTAPAPAPRPVGPQIKPETGAGEMLLVVLGGVYATRAEADEANAQTIFGDVQGYYAVPVAQFQGFREEIGSPGDFALVSVFRTEAGAQEFAAFAQAHGIAAEILPTRVRSLGGLYAGLGQEAAPDGSGPLLGPIPASLP